MPRSRTASAGSTLKARMRREIKEKHGQTKSSCTAVLWKHLGELALQDPPWDIASLIPRTPPTEPESGGDASAYD